MKTAHRLFVARVPPIARRDFERFEEDVATAKAFDRSFRLRLYAACLPAITGWLTAAILTFTSKDFLRRIDVGIFFLVAVPFGLTAVVLLLYCLGFARVRPTSLRSGKSMTVYLRDDLPAGANPEFVYLCNESRTYFMRTVRTDWS